MPPCTHVVRASSALAVAARGGGASGSRPPPSGAAALSAHMQATVRIEPLSVEIGESPVLRSTVGVLGEVVK